MRAAAIVAITALALAGCSGGEPDADSSASTPPDDVAASDTEPTEAVAGAGADDGPVALSVDGVAQDVALDICSLESIDDTPDVRMMTAVGGDGYPFFEFTHDPPHVVSARFTDSDGAGNYRTNEPDSFDVTITDAGATGTIEMASASGHDPNIVVEFAFSCPAADAGDGGTADGDGAGDEGGDEGTADAAAAKQGSVDWAGERSELDGDDFDPMAGTGLCETHDVTGLEGDDYFRIVTTLDDGTDFTLTSREGLVLGETPNPIETTIVDLVKDGRTVSGTADTPDGPLDFRFTC